MPSRIRERKLVQWTVGYLAAAWILLQVLDLVGKSYGWPNVVLRAAIVLALLGLLTVIIVGWYHGEKGRQRVTVLETLLLAGVALLAGFVVYELRGAEARVWTPWQPLLRTESVEVDPARYVLFPTRREPGARGNLQEAIRLHDALGRWRGVDIVDPFLVYDALGTRAARPLERDEMRRLARSLGAGRAVSVDVVPVAGSSRLRAVVYDTRSGRVLAEAAIQLPEDEPPDDSVFEQMAAALLFPDVAAAVRADIEPGTRSYPARRAFLEGQEALERWNLDEADARFAAAIDQDPDFARAYVWRAQVRHWRGEAAPALASLVERAVGLGERLTERELRLAEGLLALAGQDHAAACSVYAGLRDAHERDFAAWYGLGECHARDPVVLPDPGSPSGWAFRSSYHQAVEAYRRAFTMLPSAHRGFHHPTYERLGQILFTSTPRVRLGRALPPDTARFAAEPALLADTLGFVPYPTAELAEARPLAAPAAHAAAIARQRRLFHEIASGWAAAFPSSAEAVEALAVALELLADPRALSTLREARTLTGDERHRLRMATREIVLLIKAGTPDGPAELLRARALADTVLRSGLWDDPSMAGQLVVPAVLSGRVHAAADLAARAARPASWPVNLPRTVTAPAAALLVYAAVGAPGDSILAYHREVEAAIRNRMPPGEQAAARGFLLDRPASLAFAFHALPGTAELAAGSTYPLLRAQAAFAGGDPVAAWHTLEGMRAARRALRPAGLTLDAIRPEASVRVALGDPAGAGALLDSTLAEIRWIEPGGLEFEARAASLVRAMALRAELAEAAGDSATAARWAHPVAILWSQADDALQPVVDRMRALAGPVVDGAGADPPQSFFQSLWRPRWLR